MADSMPEPGGRCSTKVSPAGDVIAGLSLAGLLLPEAVAYSSVANLPPQAGVIALFSGLICYGLIGTSRFAIVSATSSSAAVLAAASATIGNGNNALRLTVAVAMVMATGLLFVVAGMAKIGSISDFIAKPVLRGFTFGLAIIISLKQVANVVGIHPPHSDIIRFVIDLFSRTQAWNWAAGASAIVALALLFLFARLPRLPGALLVIALGIGAGKWLNLSQYGIGLVGAIDLQLAAPTVPILNYQQWLRVGELSLAMVMILYAESYSSIRSFAMKHGDRVTPNRDLLAIGVGNLVAGLFHGMPAGAGYSATSANEAAGALSRRAGWCAAIALFIIVVTMLPAISLTPEPVLAAVVIHAVSHTLHPAVFRSAFVLHRDRLVTVAAVIAVLVFGVLEGLLAAIAFSLVMLLRRLAESSVTTLGRLGSGHDFVSIATHPEAQTIGEILILRPDTGLFFANADRILAQARRQLTAAADDAHTLILSLEESPDLDSSSVEAIRDFCASVLALKKQVLFARLKTPVLLLLNRAAIPGLAHGAMDDLSVDDAVCLAQQLQGDVNMVASSLPSTVKQ